MKTIIFDGRSFAKEKEEELRAVVNGLKSRGIVPRLASILVGDDEASVLYVSLKKKAAGRIGAELDVYHLPKSAELPDILMLINSLNSDRNVHGIMVQLPMPGSLSNHKSEIINAIDRLKDVDGLRDDSSFLHPTSKAVMDILHEAEKNLQRSLKGDSCKVAVIGATGMVGTPLIKELKKEGYEVLPANSKTMDLSKVTRNGDVVISATGIPGLIRAEMVKEGVIAIDVGSPKGDFDYEVEKKASFFTPVPGGVGPVTIACLLENLILAVD